MQLVHLSDLHLGFRAYRTTERGWNQRERDVAAAFRWALQETIRLGPDLVLITGDVFDHPSPPSTAFLAVHRGVSHLRAHLPGVSILIIAGERDTPRNPADPGPVAVLDALPGVEAAAGAARAVRFRRSGVHALLVPFRAAAEPPYPEVRPDPSARWNVLLVRGHPAGEGPGLALDPAEWSYIAIGGEHRARSWAPNVHSAGALERPVSSPWREATEERGFLSFDLREGVAEFHAVPGRPVVDLAPVRVDRGGVEAGTRRLRELLQGVPGGVQGKIVRVRLRGDVVTPEEGISQGLLDAVRRRATHLELQVESPAPRERSPSDPATWRAEQILVPGSASLSLGAETLTSRITLLTSESEALRAEVVEVLRPPGSGSVGGPSGKLQILPPPPPDSLSLGLWAGGVDCTRLLGNTFPPTAASAKEDRARLGDEPREGEAEDLSSLEAQLTDRRADWVEASGDLEAATLQWAQERQDADSKLQAYRDRASELRTRIRALEAEQEKAACPTCGRALGADFERLLDTLRGEWENVVQDGRWWRRRREQLDEKPPDLRGLEAHAWRLQVRVEDAAEALERLRERRRGRGGAAGGSMGSLTVNDGNGEGLQVVDWRANPDVRDALRRAGSLLSRITEGRLVGVALDKRLQVVGTGGQRRAPAGAERAALRLAVHLAIWLGARAKPTRVDSLLIWELHEAASEPLLRGALELLADTDRFDVPIVLVAPPTVLESKPEAIGQVLEITADGQDRSELRHSQLGPATIRLLSDDVPSRQVS